MKIEVDLRHFNQVTWCHVRIRCRFRIRLRSGKTNSNWNEFSSLITSCIWWKLQVRAYGPSDKILYIYYIYIHTHTLIKTNCFMTHSKERAIQKTIQCAHPPHHHNGFVETCRLWMSSDRVHALLVSAGFLLLGDKG